MAEHELEVVVVLGAREVVAGRLWSHHRRGTESQTFSYDAAYLALPDAYALDPALPLLSGSQQTPVGRSIFGAFSDSSPDRWGRVLVARSERKRVGREGGAARHFSETDYLIGVRDDVRQGALRFRVPGGMEFLAPADTGVPALIDLPRLLQGSANVEREKETDEDLELLLRGGSSLGGARPKAEVVDGDGRVAIAKFPSVTADEWDVTKWERVALELARNSGITVPDNRLEAVDGKSVLIVDRFDRAGARRIGYVSALTMLQRLDGDRGSYLEIAEAITQESPSATEDMRELWRRMAFSILISNFDDHLRNHGFIRSSSAGWRLAPAFDLNPDPRPGPRHLRTAIDFDETEASVDLLLEVAPEFRLEHDDAITVLREVVTATSAWRDVAEASGIVRAATDRMAPAFEHDATEIARAL